MHVEHSSKIVAIHGVGQLDVPTAPETVRYEQSREWAAALALGLRTDPARLDVSFVYWAPILHAGMPIAQSSGHDADSALDFLERTDPITTQLVVDWLEALGPSNVAPQGRLTIPLRHAVSLAARRFSLDGSLTKYFIARCFPEVARYFSMDNVRLAVQDHVISSMLASSAKIIIAHSLGTVIAFEALHAHPEITIDLLITLGSPLALPHGVFHRLRPPPTEGVGSRPPNVLRWVNIADHGDPIAILQPFDRYFPDVDLALVESISMFNFHRSERYLSSASVAATLQPYL